MSVEIEGEVRKYLLRVATEVGNKDEIEYFFFFEFALSASFCAGAIRVRSIAGWCGGERGIMVCFAPACP